MKALLKHEKLTLGISIALSCVAYFFLVKDQFKPEFILNYFNSDMAIFYLMAQEILGLDKLPIYYYGQNYMGPFTSMWIALNQVILNLFQVIHKTPISEIKYAVSPLSGFLACTQMLWLGIVFFSLSAKKIYNLRTALLLLLFMTIGTPLLWEYAVRPMGVEMAWFLSSLLLFQGLRTIEDSSNKNLWLMGILSGFSWWNNQTVIFIFLPLLLFALLRNERYQSWRPKAKLSGIMLGNFPVIHSKKWSFTFKTLSRIALLIFIIGLVASWWGRVDETIMGLRIRFTSGSSQVKTAIKVWAVLQILAFVFKGGIWRALAITKDEFEKNYQLIFGFLMGFSPVLLGKVFGWYDKWYGVKFYFLPFKELPNYINRLVTDFFPGVYAVNSAWWVLLIAFIIGFVFYSEFSKKEKIRLLQLFPGHYQVQTIVFFSIALNIIYIVLSERSFNQYALRYGILLIPMGLMPVFYFCSKRLLHSLLLIVFIFTWKDLPDKNTAFFNKVMATTPDTKKIDSLINSNCDVVFGDYWDVYKYEYLLQHRPLFAINQGQERTPKWTKERSEMSGKKCSLDLKGNIKLIP